MHLLFALSLALPLSAAEVARWTPAESKGLAVEPAGWDRQGDVAVVRTVRDYFHRAEFAVRIDPPRDTPSWLVVEYFDYGYALISVTGGVPVGPVARLNTGRPRKALFLVSSGVGRVAIQGVETLRSLALHDARPPIEPAPPVEPVLAFERPCERVTTAGADASTPDQLPQALENMRQLLPLARAHGFNGIESYVKWNFVERSPGVFDWSFYDAIVDEIEKHGLHWFPLLVVGSAYTLPDWYHDSPENIGFECLEHGKRNDIQSIFAHKQDKYVERFLREFGKHYGPRKAVLGVRLGPSGNYGEAQYPARGDWGWHGQPIHTHIGYWAADRFAQESFRAWLRKKYGDTGALNRAWEDRLESFEQARTFLPVTASSLRKRLDFAGWYMGAMSRWCEQWAEWAREAMPRMVIHQSSGGWGPIEIGTDYTYQARTMARLKGGIRLTNESDNYPQNFAITRMASSAARFYGARLGYEPGGFGSARGVAARLFNMITNGADHLFYYHGNLYGNDQAIGTWLRHAPLLDRRAPPMIDVAAFYPDTAIALDDEPVRYLWASAFLSRAEAMRSVVDFDYASEPMVLDGALDRYKVLVFLWGHITEKPVLERIAKWVEAGGVLVYPERPRGPLQTVEGDLSVWPAWRRGRTGKGRVIFFNGDPEPGDPYARFVRDELRGMEQLRPAVRAALSMDKPREVYWSVLENGELALLNFSDDPATVRVGRRNVALEPYGIVMAAQ